MMSSSMCEMTNSIDCLRPETRYGALVNILSTLLNKYTPSADYAYFRSYNQRREKLTGIPQRIKFVIQSILNILIEVEMNESDRSSFLIAMINALE
jgi:hypothetical protein